MLLSSSFEASITIIIVVARSHRWILVIIVLILTQSCCRRLRHHCCHRMKPSTDSRMRGGRGGAERQLDLAGRGGGVGSVPPGTGTGRSSRMWVGAERRQNLHGRRRERRIRPSRHCHRQFRVRVVRRT
ncbi:Os04g0400300 [Oryza sativa Japonica Group]|uniref:Os04g0400300 protein n=1 Tax=Oryza sativa subsp. japonica TaxID=39947 RepID=A0A0P0W9Y8_ORYSJ|nr:Os04g0400300 [Oryza sativa Japonica Group]